MAQTFGTVQSQPAPAASPQEPKAAPVLIDEALKVAKASNKTVMVYTRASWCGYCKLLEKFLQSPEAGKLMADHYVFVPLTTQEGGTKKALMNPGTDSVMKAMNVGGGLPNFFFLDATGKKIGSSMVMPPGGDNMGHPYKPEEIKAFGDLLQQTAPRMTEAERTKIMAYLTELATPAPKPAPKPAV